MNKEIEWLIDIKIAHRGLHYLEKGIPENTIAAFSKAIEKSIAIELDVHILKDNNIIVFHDDTLNRCCNINKKIKDLTIKDIKEVKLFNTEHKISTFSDVLDYIDARVPIVIEVKTDVSSKRICPELLKSLENYNGKFAIKSFNPAVCLWLKKHAPNITRGLLITDFKKEKGLNLLKKLFISSMLFVPIYKPNFLSVRLSMLKNKKIKNMREKGYTILGWTFKNKTDYIKYHSYCDSYIFEEKGKSYT